MLAGRIIAGPLVLAFPNAASCFVMLATFEYSKWKYKQQGLSLSAGSQSSGTGCSQCHQAVSMPFIFSSRTHEVAHVELKPGN